MHNLSAAAPHWELLLICFADFRDDPPPDVKAKIAALVAALRASVQPSSWQTLVAAMNKKLRKAISTKYGPILQ